MQIAIRTPLHVVIDPHDGTCQGAHNIAVVGMSLPSENGTRKTHVTLTWGPSAILSIRGSQEFAEGMHEALRIAQQMENEGEYIAAVIP